MGDKTINWIFAILGAILLAVGLMAALLAPASLAPPALPAAAASEAMLICQTFDGLTSFTVKAGDVKATPDGQLRSYTVAATCKSGHTVTGVIGVQVDAK